MQDEPKIMNLTMSIQGQTYAELISGIQRIKLALIDKEKKGDGPGYQFWVTMEAKK